MVCDPEYFRCSGRVGKRQFKEREVNLDFGGRLALHGSQQAALAESAQCVSQANTLRKGGCPVHQVGPRWPRGLYITSSGFKYALDDGLYQVWVALASIPEELQIIVSFINNIKVGKVLGGQQENLEEGITYRENQTCRYLLVFLTKPFNWVTKLMTFYSKNMFFLWIC